MIIHLLITDWFKGLLPADTPTHADLYKNLFDSVVPDAEYSVYAAMEGELPDLTDPEARPELMKRTPGSGRCCSGSGTRKRPGSRFRASASALRRSARLLAAA